MGLSSCAISQDRSARVQHRGVPARIAANQVLPCIVPSHQFNAGLNRFVRSTAMSRSFVRGLVRWVVVVLLLGQLAIAAYACPALRVNVADVGQSSFAGVACDMAVAGEGMLADGSALLGALDIGSPNLCAEHCKQGHQSDQTSSITVPAATVLAPVENNPPRLVESRLRPRASSLNALVSTCPPHAILHCVRRT